VSLTRAELAERAERKAQDAAAKARILRRLGWRPETVDALAAAFAISQAPAALATCREVTARRLRDLAEDGLIMPDGAVWRLKGSPSIASPSPSPSDPSTRAGEVFPQESAMPKTGPSTPNRLPAEQTRELTRAALANFPYGATARQLFEQIAEGRPPGEVVIDGVKHALDVLEKTGEAAVDKARTQTGAKTWRPTQRQPIAKAEPAPAHDVTCYDVEAEKAAREPSADPSGEVIIVPAQMPPGFNAPPVGFLSVAVIHAALDAADAMKHSDPLHRIQVLGELAQERREDAEAKGAVLDELCRLLNLEDCRGLPALVEHLVRPVWVSSPLGDLCIVSSTVYVSVPAHAPAGTHRQAEILDDDGRILARVSIDTTWPELRWRPLLLDIRAKLVDPALSDIPF
jgi:hypothetical protein